MKALIKDKKEKGFSYKDMPISKPKPNEVLVRVKTSAICGSDINFYVWNSWCEKVIKSLPFIPGHEGSGEVIDKGGRVQHLREGDKVAFETHLPCGMCFQCRTGSPHICRNMELFGHTFNGCFAEYCIIPHVIARKVPEELPYEKAAILEPMGVSLRAVDEAELGGDSVLIIGAGPIGQFAIGLSELFGASKIISIDINDNRLEVSKKMGADYTINPQRQDSIKTVLALTEGDGVGVVIECSGNVKAIRNGFKVMRKGGRFLFVGNPKEPLVLDVFTDIVHKEAKIRGIHGRELFKTWQKTESILLSDRLDISPIITHKFSLSGYEEAFELALKGDACKVMFIHE